MATIEGSTTGDPSRALIRLYNVTGGEERLLGTALWNVADLALTAMAQYTTEPDELAIPVSVEPK